MMKIIILLILLTTIYCNINNNNNNNNKIGRDDDHHHQVSKQGLIMNEITLEPNKNQEAYLSFNGYDSEYNVGLNKDNDFVINNDGFKILTIDDDLDVISHVPLIKVENLVADSIYIHDVEQWKLINIEEYRIQKYIKGWNSDTIMACGGIDVLVPRMEEIGGLWIDNLVKNITNLPIHNQVLIEANFHFIDDWQGENAYLKIDGKYQWTDNHELRFHSSNTNLCGKSAFPESKFSVPISVVAQSQGDSMLIEFGSTLAPHSDALFGISSLSIYVRNA